MSNYIIYDGSDPKEYLKGYSILVIGSPKSCESCVDIKRKLGFFSKRYPEVNFIFWDFDEFPDLYRLEPGLMPMAFPYVRSYFNNYCNKGSYSAELYILEDMIKILKKEYDNN